jgi:hypothetical protein
METREQRHDCIQEATARRCYTQDFNRHSVHLLTGDIGRSEVVALTRR